MLDDGGLRRSLERGGGLDGPVGRSGEGARRAARRAMLACECRASAGQLPSLPGIPLRLPVGNGEGARRLEVVRVAGQAGAWVGDGRLGSESGVRLAISVPRAGPTTGAFGHVMKEE
jgi:hypothetical protein